METSNSDNTTKPKGGCGSRPCCQCKPIRIMRNRCIENNNGEEAPCIDFINAFKACVAAKKAQAAAAAQMNSQTML